MAADQGYDGGDYVDVDEGQGIPPDARAAAEAMAEHIANEARERFERAGDPYDQAQAERQAEQDAVMAARASELIQRYPELDRPEVAQQTIADARRVAAELGQLDLASSPDFWVTIHEARKAGATSANLTARVREQSWKTQVFEGADKGHRALPFGH